MSNSHQKHYEKKPNKKPLSMGLLTVVISLPYNHGYKPLEVQSDLLQNLPLIITKKEISDLWNKLKFMLKFCFFAHAFLYSRIPHLLHNK